MNTSNSKPPVNIVIFVASGDLTQRKLVPALHSLACQDLLSSETRIVGIARTPLSDEAFHDWLYQGVESYARVKPGVCELWPQLAARYSYLAGGYDDPETYRRLTERLAQLGAGEQDNVLFYLATPPELYPVIIGQLGQAA